MLEDFGESQEDIFRQLTEIGSEHQRAEELKKAEVITVPHNDSAEQNEPPPNPSNTAEVTTTLSIPTEDTDR